MPVSVTVPRDNEIANVRVFADLGCLDKITSAAVATRGERLVLARQLFSLHDGPQSFQNEIVDVIEIDSSGKLSGHVVFDPDDIDAAFDELDARYLAERSRAVCARLVGARSTRWTRPIATSRGRSSAA